MNASRRLLLADVAILTLLALAIPARASAPPPPSDNPPPGSARLVSLEQSAEQPLPCYKVPGRAPDSRAAWQVFLGQAAHRLIAYMYGVNHPGNKVFYNRETLSEILTSTGLGDASLLLRHESNLCPDITDTALRCVFEIKPRHDAGLQEGRRQVRTYLDALNSVVSPGKRFSRGTEFQGEILIRFDRGQYIWRLEWKTLEPGVVQYQWTRSRERFESEQAAYEAGQWEELTEQEMKQYGGWVGQAVEGMVSRREQLASFSSAVGVLIEVAGGAAVGFFSGALLGRMGTRPDARQPPTGSGKVIPLPLRTTPPAPPAARPAAMGR